MSERKIFSHHHFMFPFRWDVLHKGFSISDIKENISFDERTDLKKIPDRFSNWERIPYLLTKKDGVINEENYNEFTYYHEFVQKAIFDYEYPWKKEQNIVKYFEYIIDKNLNNQYIIKYLEREPGNSYKEQQLILEVDGVTLHFFCTGVGVLTFNLSNFETSQANEESILKINEYGRRMYPQYLGIGEGLKSTKNNFLANEIILRLNETVFFDDDFSFYTSPQPALKPYEPYRLPTFIKGLFNDYFIFRMEDTKLPDEKILITKVTDDRMFFHSWYGNDAIANLIKTDYCNKNEILSNWFYAYVFGDKETDFSISNKKLQLEQIKKHSYDRWIEHGTLYGLSRDSFVCVTGNSWFATNILRVHMQSIYYSLSVLCLAQRTSILKFTAEVANLSDLAKIDNNKMLVNNIKEVYKNYIEFINKLYFREITPQIQGIELYNQFQVILNIDKEITDLDNEISELHEYVSLLQDEKRNEEATRLNRMAVIFIPATLMFGILGANFFTDEHFTENFFSFKTLFWLVIGFLPSVLFYFIYSRKNKR